MTRDEKKAIIDSIAEQISNNKHFYLTDIAALNASDTMALRGKCFEKQIKLVMVKNTLLRQAFERFDGQYEDLYGVLKENTSVMFCDGASDPAKLIKEFRKTKDKPVLKGAYVEESVYIGEETLDTLATIKSKEEVIADIIALLQSPAKNVISGLQSSGGQKIAGILETLSEKEN